MITNEIQKDLQKSMRSKNYVLNIDAISRKKIWKREKYVLN
ncbi:15959_t:CDS:1, partial [Gigaspora rosea]